MKRFIGVLCAHCNTYFRIYPDSRNRCYQGRCPKCLRMARALIDAVHGTKRRFFIGR